MREGNFHRIDSVAFVGFLSLYRAALQMIMNIGLLLYTWFIYKLAVCF